MGPHQFFISDISFSFIDFSTSYFESIGKRSNETLHNQCKNNFSKLSLILFIIGYLFLLEIYLQFTKDHPLRAIRTFLQKHKCLNVCLLDSACIVESLRLCRHFSSCSSATFRTFSFENIMATVFSISSNSCMSLLLLDANTLLIIFVRFVGNSIRFPDKALTNVGLFALSNN